MPRRAPTEIVEQRITFGNYERQFVTEVKNDIEKGVKIAAISAIAVPVTVAVGAVGGLGLLGYFIYRGMDGYAFGTNLNNPFGENGIILHFNRIIDPSFYSAVISGTTDTYVDKKDR